MITEQAELSSTEIKTSTLLIDAIASGVTLKDIQGVPDNVMEGIYAYAFEYYQSGRLEDAVVMFRFLCMYDVHNLDYKIGLGATLQQLKQYQDAIDVYACAQNDYRALLHTAQCHLFLKNTEQARKNFGTLLESDAPTSIKTQAQAYLAAMKPAEVETKITE